VENSYESLAGQVSLHEGSRHSHDLPALPDWYRLQNHGRGMDADESDGLIDHYLLQL
jgi:hypothetical protein